jgi:adhesin/invasin
MPTFTKIGSIFARGALCVVLASGAAVTPSWGEAASGTKSSPDGSVLKSAPQAGAFFSYFGGELPEWMKRFEVNWNFFDTNKSEQSVLTVQPLYQSYDKRETIFIQASAFHYALYGDYRWTGNLGLGYRRLLAGNTVMLGANAFFDNEFTYNHRRVSAGLEAKWGPLDFHANNYTGITEDKSASGYLEKALDGRDLALKTQVPYLPWAKVGASYFWWDAEHASSDMKGASLSAEFALHPNLSLDYRWSSYNVADNNSENTNAIFLRFHLARLDEPTLATGPVVASQAFKTRDLSGQTLKKVVRENRIIVERRTSGGSVIIARGN